MNTERNSIGVFRVLGVFVSGHKFYVCNFRTKHKICILAYHNLCFCVFVFLGMLHCRSVDLSSS
jgi:hypothetical protein